MLEVEKTVDKWIIQVKMNRLDIMNSNELLNEIQNIIKEADQEIYFDLSNLDFMDSAILGVFVRLHQVAKSNGKKFTFTKMTPFVKNLFIHSRMDRLFNLG